MDCLPPSGPCICHECQGIFCLFYHAGHSHRETMTKRGWLETLLKENRRALREERMADNLREACDD